MPNGCHICCEYCTYNRLTPGKCDIFGIEAGPFILCRSFRMPKQSHEGARRRHPELTALEPGVVYSIENTTAGPADPRPAYRVVAVA